MPFWDVELSQWVKTRRRASLTVKADTRSEAERWAKTLAPITLPAGENDDAWIDGPATVAKIEPMPRPNAVRAILDDASAVDLLKLWSAECEKRSGRDALFRASFHALDAELSANILLRNHLLPIDQLLAMRKLHFQRRPDSDETGLLDIVDRSGNLVAELTEHDVHDWLRARGVWI